MWIKNLPKLWSKIPLANALRATLPNSSTHVSTLVGEFFDKVYQNAYPAQEEADPELLLQQKREEASRLQHWAKHLQYSLPKLKRMRFGTSFAKPATLKDQLAEIQLDPKVELPRGMLGLMELQNLKAEVRNRAQTRLGGMEVKLEDIDPKRLDGVDVVTGVIQEFMKKQAHIEATAPKL